MSKVKKSITLEESTITKIETAGSMRNLKFSQAVEFKVEKADNFYMMYEAIEETLSLYGEYNKKERPDLMEAQLMMINNIMKNLKESYEQ